MSNHVIADYMTPSPHTIGIAQPLMAAHELMRAHQIRHLPVLDGGDVVGVVTMSDLHLVETIKDVDPQTVTIEDAMTPEPYCVGPRALLRKVAAEMATRKCGSAIVLQRGRVVGIFTTTDALRALAEAS